MDGNGIRTQTLLDLSDNTFEIRTGTIHFVDEGHARHTVFVALAPHRLRLRFYTSDRAEYGTGTIQDPQGTLHLYGEIHVTRSIDNIDTVLRIGLIHPFPECGGGCGGNGDTSLLLLFHPIHDGVAVMDLTQLM